MLENSREGGNKLFNCLSLILRMVSAFYIYLQIYIILHFAFDAASFLINIYTKFI